MAAQTLKSIAPPKPRLALVVEADDQVDVDFEEVPVTEPSQIISSPPPSFNTRVRFAREAGRQAALHEIQAIQHGAEEAMAELRERRDREVREVKRGCFWENFRTAAVGLSVAAAAAGGALFWVQHLSQEPLISTSQVKVASQVATLAGATLAKQAPTQAASVEAQIVESADAPEAEANETTAAPKKVSPKQTAKRVRRSVNKRAATSKPVQAAASANEAAGEAPAAATSAAAPKKGCENADPNDPMNFCL